MNKISRWLRGAFGFNRKEINGFIVLTTIMVLVLAVPSFYNLLMPPEAYDSTADEQALELMMQQLEKEEKEDVEAVPEKTDKKKTRKSYIVKQEKEWSPASKKDTTRTFKNYSKPKYEITAIHLNTADTTAFKQIRGIGSKLSERIITFRDKLGGFVSKEQLHEVYGLDSTLILENEAHFVLDNPTPFRLILVNSATVKELVAHPYISYKKAIAIANYRDQHGRYSSVEDLAKIHLLDEADLKRLTPYLSFD